MCRPLLIEIRKTVAAYDRWTAWKKAEEKADRKHEGPEKNPEKALADISELRYNALKCAKVRTNRRRRQLPIIQKLNHSQVSRHIFVKKVEGAVV